MRTRAIINPAAGNGRVRQLWPDLEPRLRDVAPGLTVEWTTAPNEATALTRAALRDGAERIAAVGGDGTLHEVVNGFFAEDGTPLKTDACLVPIPCGSGTDFCRALPVPTGLDAVQILRSERIQPIDLLRIAYSTPEGKQARRYAVNIASFGLSSRVVQAVNRGGGRLPGPLRYFGGILRALNGHRTHPVDLTLDGTPLNASEIHLAAVANGHTFGGGIRIAPNARFDDGELDIVVLHDISAFTLLRRLSRFYKGTHLALDGVTAARGHRFTAHARTDAPIWVEADGEVLGRLPITVEVVPQALRMQY